MKPRRDETCAAGFAGALLLAIPMLDVVLGGAFGAVHAVLGLTGLALLVPAMLAREA